MPNTKLDKYIDERIKALRTKPGKDAMNERIRLWRDQLSQVKDSLKDKSKTSDVYFPLKEVIGEMDEFLL